MELRRVNYSENYRERARGRHWVGGIAAVAIGAAVVVGAYFIGQESRTVPVVEPAASPAGPKAAVAWPAVASPDPVLSATSWLHAYRTVTAQDAAASAWIDRVMPVVTGQLADSYEQAREGSSGARWAEFQERGCVTTVEDAGGVIPDEAPRSETVVNVQVSGRVTTICADRQAPPTPDETLGATLSLERGEDGLWRVSRRLY
ncbi:hypothetical protein GCM10023175_54010 [Pseudonocardia xishanensis]|uniref:Mce-associated membrane protein n=1 Tax=Pseudonocardia xishanensis TaxID=630995 RepID=A0ABP8S0P4_9PSEU